jgi:hypothetical protein
MTIHFDRSAFVLCIVLFYACTITKPLKINVQELTVLENREQANHMGSVIIGEKNLFTIDTAFPNHTPLRNLRVNFHFVNSSDSLHNFSEDSGKVFVYKLLQVMQILFDKNDKMKFPKGNDIPVIPVNIKYILSNQKGDDGIYFHYDDDLVYYNHMGPTRNNSDYTLIEKYGIGVDSIINFFILPHHPDSVKSKTYQSGCVGIALGNAVKMAGIYEKGFNEWNVRGTFNHEVGHILGLYHAWSDDGCDDTPMHANDCWADASPGCDGRASNNMMDYNAWQSALTPCQLDIIHANLSNPRHQNRNLLIKSWCRLDPFKQIQISDSVLWTNDRDLETNVEILPGAILKIKCRVSMPPGSKIKVHPGGKLILEHCTLHNDCGKSWYGIEALKKGKSVGQVVKMKNVVVKDIDPVTEVNK